jgi:hypothetical protein
LAGKLFLTHAHTSFFTATLSDEEQNQRVGRHDGLPTLTMNIII